MKSYKKKVIKYLKHPIAFFVRLLVAYPKLIRSDKFFIKLRYYLSFNKWPNLDSPKTFNEKIQWLKLNDRKTDYCIMVDKYEAKKYVASILGDKYIIPTIDVYDSVEEININLLPNQFVLKCTHDSGGIVICKDKSDFDLQNAKKRIRKFLSHNYYWGSREWPYKNVKPRIIAEKYMVDDSGELQDYKFMCFGGKVRCVFTVANRYGDGGIYLDFYDTNWNLLPFSRHYPNTPSNLSRVKKPKSFEQMISFAEILSQNMIFARIDFYEISDTPYFGEITLYPGSGFEEFTPEAWDLELGKWINIAL